MRWLGAKERREIFKFDFDNFIRYSNMLCMVTDGGAEYSVPYYGNSRERYVCSVCGAFENNKNKKPLFKHWRRDSGPFTGMLRDADIIIAEKGHVVDSKQYSVSKENYN